MRIKSTTVVMPRDIFEDRLMRSKTNLHKWEDQICEGITIADLEEQRIRGGVRLGVERGRMAFVWVTFKRTTINAYNPTSSSLNPSTSKKNNKLLRLKAFLSIIGENGASLKMLMEGMHLRDRKSFVNNYINPNLAEGYIAMLYPEIPNHPMQSYYLTNKGRELLKRMRAYQKYILVRPLLFANGQL